MSQLERRGVSFQAKRYFDQRLGDSSDSGHFRIHGKGDHDVKTFSKF